MLGWERPIVARLLEQPGGFRDERVGFVLGNDASGQPGAVDDDEARPAARPDEVERRVRCRFETAGDAGHDIEETRLNQDRGGRDRTVHGAHAVVGHEKHVALLAELQEAGGGLVRRAPRLVEACG